MIHRFLLPTLVLACVAGSAATLYAQLERTKAPAGAQAYFISPKDGEEVTSPVTVRFGLRGIGVAPAGVQKDGTGHHHILIDTDLSDPSMPIPSDTNHVHFGGGQTETQLKLEPGKHTLQLVLGDFRHIPLDPIVESQKITITVKK